MPEIGIFPFGEEVQKIEQTDRSPKKAFVLGVYASAVHARWINLQGKTVVRAMAVASEPYIFWRGENVEEIIGAIQIPHQLGRLVAADVQFNGPSGIALDKQILKPLGLAREDVWLCDLIPHSCMNAAQQKAIEREYMPLVEKYDLPVPTVPKVPSRLTDDQRRKAILEEIEKSNAEEIIVLGDKPIQWFLNYYDERWMRLSDFPLYGKRHLVKIAGKPYSLLPLAHPRQIARLGRSSRKWFELHQIWADSDSKLRGAG
jgi:uracil-DNA glycosylase